MGPRLIEPEAPSLTTRPFSPASALCSPPSVSILSLASASSPNSPRIAASVPSAGGESEAQHLPNLDGRKANVRTQLCVEKSEAQHLPSHGSTGAWGVMCP